MNNKATSTPTSTKKPIPKKHIPKKATTPASGSDSEDRTEEDHFNDNGSDSEDKLYQPRDEIESKFDEEFEDVGCRSESKKSKARKGKSKADRSDSLVRSEAKKAKSRKGKEKADKSGEASDFEIPFE